MCAAEPENAGCSAVRDWKVESNASRHFAIANVLLVWPDLRVDGRHAHTAGPKRRSAKKLAMVGKALAIGILTPLEPSVAASTESAFRFLRGDIRVGHQVQYWADVVQRQPRARDWRAHCQLHSVAVHLPLNSPSSAQKLNRHAAAHRASSSSNPA